MSILGRMLRTARRGAAALGDRGAAMARFVLGGLNADGGFSGRSGGSDLYYTVFALQCLSALQRPAPEESGDYLQAFGPGDGLDLVHLACLARARALVSRPSDEPDRLAVARHVLAFRSTDGGFSMVPAGPAGEVYACFLALGACQDLSVPLPEADGLARCVNPCRLEGGGYVNAPPAGRNGPGASVPATAAAMTVLHHLGRASDAQSVAWLTRMHRPKGGLAAFASAPQADLLSTAVGLHALAEAGADLGQQAGTCRRFVTALWRDAGGFCSQADDDAPDGEYTFYALLALGELCRSP